jgi:hypothetical protein
MLFFRAGIYYSYNRGPGADGHGWIPYSLENLLYSEAIIYIMANNFVWRSFTDNNSRLSKY